MSTYITGDTHGDFSRFSPFCSRFHTSFEDTMSSLATPASIMGQTCETISENPKSQNSHSHFSVSTATTNAVLIPSPHTGSNNSTVGKSGTSLSSHSFFSLRTVRCIRLKGMSVSL